MGEKVSLLTLLDMLKKIWTFRVSHDPRVADHVARQQLASIAQISRIGSIIALPFTIYVMVKLYTHAAAPFLVIASICYAIASFVSLRNYFRSDLLTPDVDDPEHSFRVIHAESIIIALCFGGMVALPLAFGQLPVDPDLGIFMIGNLVLSGFVYGSIPRAQSSNLAVSTVIFSAALFSLSGLAAIGSVALLATLALCIDFIYRMYFYNFVQRHVHAFKQRNAAETVRLLLHDYAAQSSDWLWEVDGQGRIVNPSARFASAVGLEISQLRGRSLASLFSPSPEHDQLIEHLTAGTAFRDLQLPIDLDGARCWWTLSGRSTHQHNNRNARMRGVAADITATKAAEEQVAHLAHFDALTDLPNRTLFHESLSRSVARMKPQQSIAVLYLDLDHFKGINDMLGHGAGDQVLKTVAARLESNIGIEDMAARFGGDEFAIMLRHVESHDEVMAQAQRLIDAMAEPVMVDGHPVQTGLSVGIALAPEHGRDAEPLIKHADIALYHAKEQGRGCASMFRSSLGEAVQDRRNIEMDLRAALHRDELELHYQPLVNAATGETLGYEALLRWNHATRGMIMPDIFIPVAEDTGLIVQLGEWVIRAALDEVAKWPDHLSVAVNLSPAQMRSPNLLPTIVSGLAATGVAPHRLELEITESVLMNESNATVELLHKIRGLGVRIALDDFGTGYSSLNYLRSFPFDKIKIDRCFVEEIDSREDCRAIIRAVTGLASSLGMVTTAEGVERDDQLSQLREDGCEQVQGYLFSKAVPAAEINGRAVVQYAPSTVSKAAFGQAGEDPAEPRSAAHRRRA